MTSNVIYGSTDDGTISSAHATYATALAGSSLTADTSAASITVGQATGYTLWEAFLSFDISGLTGSVGYAILALDSTGAEATAWTLYAAPLSWGTLTTADWQDQSELAALTPLDTGFPMSSKAALGYQNVAVIGGSVFGASPFQLVLWSSTQEAGSAPAAIEDTGWASANDTGTTRDPKLTVHTFQAGYPYVAGVATTVTSGSGNQTVNLPSGIAADDILLIFAGTDGDQTADFHPTGWTTANRTNNGTEVSGTWMHKVATGSEGATVTCNVPDNEPGAWTSLIIRNVDTSNYLGPTAATGSDAAPDPPSGEDPGASSVKALILASASWDHTDTFSTYPSTYEGIHELRSGTGSGDNGTALAYKEVESADAPNPGAFGISGTEGWVAHTYGFIGLASNPNATITTTAIASAAAVDSPTKTAAASHTTSAIATQAFVDTPTLRMHVSITTAEIALQVVVDGAAVTVTASVSIIPDSVQSFAFPSDSPVVGNANAPPVELAALAALDTPTVEAHASITTTTVVAQASVDTPDVLGNTSITEGDVVGQATVETPTVVGSASIVAGDVVGQATVETPTVVGSASIVAGDIAVQVFVDTPAINTDHLLVVGDVLATSFVPTPTISTGSGAASVVFLDKPLNVTATPISSDQIDLDWDAVAGAATYDVMRNGVVIQTGIVLTSWSNTGLDPGTLYTYRVKAYA